MGLRDTMDLEGEIRLVGVNRRRGMVGQGKDNASEERERWGGRRREIR